MAATTRSRVDRKGKLSEEELRFEEEAFNNALIELEVLGKTAAQLAAERTALGNAAAPKLKPLAELRSNG